jgi:hypothetical protein
MVGLGLVKYLSMKHNHTKKQRSRIYLSGHKKCPLIKERKKEEICHGKYFGQKLNHGNTF